MLTAIVVQVSPSVAAVSKTLRRVAPWVLGTLVAAVAASCASMGNRPDLVMETAAPALGDAAFARDMALRRGAIQVKVPRDGALHVMSDDAPVPQRAMKDRRTTASGAIK